MNQGPGCLIRDWEALDSLPALAGWLGPVLARGASPTSTTLKFVAYFPVPATVQLLHWGTVRQVPDRPCYGRRGQVLPFLCARPSGTELTLRSTYLQYR